MVSVFHIAILWCYTEGLSNHFQMLRLIFTMVLNGSLARISVQNNAVIGPHVRTNGWLELGSTVSWILNLQ